MRAEVSATRAFPKCGLSIQTWQKYMHTRVAILRPFLQTIDRKHFLDNGTLREHVKNVSIYKFCVPKLQRCALNSCRLNTYFAFWRSSQSATSPLPVAVVITFYSQACAFSKALLPLIEEVAQHYSKQSIKFLRVDIAQLAYSDMIKMGITTTPVIRLHTQVSKQIIR